MTKIPAKCRKSKISGTILSTYGSRVFHGCKSLIDRHDHGVRLTIQCKVLLSPHDTTTNNNSKSDHHTAPRVSYSYITVATRPTIASTLTQSRSTTRDTQDLTSTNLNPQPPPTTHSCVIICSPILYPSRPPFHCRE